VIVPVLLLFVLFQANFGARAGSLNAQLEAARKEGVPVDVDDVRQIPPDDPTQNADKLYAQFLKLSEDPKYRLFLGVIKERNPSPSQESKAVRGLQPLADVVEKAVQRPYLVPQQDWSNPPAIEFPEFKAARDMARLMCGKAREYSRQGEGVEAVRTLTRAHTIAKHAAQSPTLIGLLVSISVETLLFATLETVLSDHGRNPQVIAEAKRFVASLGPVPSLRRAIGGEVIFSRSPFMPNADPVQIISGAQTTDDPTSQALAASLTIKPVRDAMEARAIEEFRALYRDMPTDLEDVDGFEKALNDMESRVTRDRNVTSSFLKTTTPVYSSVVNALKRIIAERRLAALAVDLCERRLQGPLPKNLTPIGRHQVDPYSGGPFLIKAVGQGFLVYSVGLNGVDDGGQEADLLDVVFRVKR
jgi:hypothetical protein